MPDTQQRHLYILRHAKSDWGTGATTDFDRPLATRGIKDAPRMGKWMRKHKLIPDFVLSSSALRAKQTVLAVTKELNISEPSIHFDKNLYLASLSKLIKTLNDCPQGARQVLLVGHNPGMDDLLGYLCTQELPYSESGKLMTTAALAHVQLEVNWGEITQACGRLVKLTRPRDLE